MHWNAGNLPIDICEYTRELFKEKDHAYLSDYFRWWVLREYGGIYLDADIEIINGEKFNTLVEELANTTEYHSFFGVELLDSKTYTPQSMACKKNSPLAQFMCSLYENMGELSKIRREWPFCATRLPHLYFINHLSAKKTSYTNDGWIDVIKKPVICGQVKIYPQEYLSPLDKITTNYYENGTWEHVWGLKQESTHTCICHHFSNSYMEGIVPSSSRKNIHYQDYLTQYRNNKQKKLEQPITTQQKYQNLQQDKYYRFGQLSRKQKIKKIIVVILKKLKLYPVLKKVYNIIKK